MGLSGVKTSCQAVTCWLHMLLWDINNVAVKFFGKFYNFNCVLCSFCLINCFTTYRAAQLQFQPYASEFCKKSEDIKVLKLCFRKGITAAFFGPS